MAMKLARMRERSEMKANPLPSNPPKPLPPTPISPNKSPNAFGNNNVPTNPKPLPTIPPKKVSVVSDSPFKNNTQPPTPSSKVSAFQQRILDAQANSTPVSTKKFSISLIDLVYVSCYKTKLYKLSVHYS